MGQSVVQLCSVMYPLYSCTACGVHCTNVQRGVSVYSCVAWSVNCTAVQRGVSVLQLWRDVSVVQLCSLGCPLYICVV